ncbi:MAG: DUF420 domain-containing protein [Myxococcota bacterium]
MDQTSTNRGPVFAILAVSAAAVAFLFWIIYFKPGTARAEGNSVLPAVNATLNAASALCVAIGTVLIRRKQHQAHATAMVAAFAFSAAFLVCYIVYYWLHGNTVFTGQGWIRPVYFSILISHILLSIVALPMVLTTFYFSVTKQFSRHRPIARWTYPLWLYVSVTGVVVFFLVKNFA